MYVLTCISDSVDMVQEEKVADLTVKSVLLSSRFRERTRAIGPAGNFGVFDGHDGPRNENGPETYFFFNRSPETLVLLSLSSSLSLSLSLSLCMCVCLYVYVYIL